MTELLTAAQMRAIEQAAIDSGEVTGLELMERAGQGVVDAIFEEWPELGEREYRAVVLCGPGNNGGDGFVVARLLKEAGWEVEVFLYGDAEKLPPDAKVNCERLGELGDVGLIGFSQANGQSIQSFRDSASSLPELRSDPSGSDDNPFLLVDALFGTGLSRPISGLYDLCAHWDYLTNFGDLNASRIVSIDIPSGLDSDSGSELREKGPNPNPFAVLAADLTVTFHRMKMGHVIARGPAYCGRVRVADIGLDGRWIADSVVLLNEKVPAVSFLGKDGDYSHKYSHGHALILSGGVGKGGAARLSARGALRIGAGAVTIGCPPAALIENAAQLNAVMLKSIKDDDVLTEVLQDKRITALCIGPGLGLADREVGLVAAALNSTRPGLDPGPQGHDRQQDPGSSPGRGLVLDADALTLLAQDDSLFAKLHANCVLTPHAGEFARLFPDIAEKLNAPATKGPAYSKVDATREAATRAGCVVLFKGPDTVIADPTGRCIINASVYERSAPWLATAGSGDVLAGFITGLLARGFSPMQAAETGAWLHTECALSFGPGLIAEDLAEELPKVFQALGV